MEKQVAAFREAVISARAELKEVKQELAWSEKSIDFLSRSARESEEGRQEPSVGLERMKWALDAETLRFLRCCEERKSMRSEKVRLRDENQLLRGMVRDMEARMDEAFRDGYFYASYEIAKVYPPPFDLKASLGWDREQVKAKASQLSGSAPVQVDSSIPAALSDHPQDSTLPAIDQTGEVIVPTTEPPPQQEERVDEAAGLMEATPTLTNEMEDPAIVGVVGADGRAAEAS